MKLSDDWLEDLSEEEKLELYIMLAELKRGRSEVRISA